MERDRHYIMANNYNNHALHFAFPHKSHPSDGELSSDMNIPDMNEELSYDIFEKGQDRMNSFHKVTDFTGLPQIPEHGCEMATNFVDTVGYHISREPTDSSFNTARQSISKQQTMEMDRNHASVRSKPDLINVANKASDFWEKTFGARKQTNEQYPGQNIINAHHQQQAKLNQGKIVQQIQPKIDPSNLQIDRRFSDRGEYSHPSEFSYNLQPHRNVTDIKSVFRQESKAQQSNSRTQPNSGRNNTLYKFLNQYMGSNDTAKNPIPQLKTVENKPAIMKSDLQEVSEGQRCGNNSLGPTSNDSNSQVKSQQNVSKSNSSSLRMKLEASQLVLPNSNRLQQLRDKTDRKYARRLWTPERDHLLKSLVKVNGYDWDRIASEMQDPQITSRMVRERYANKFDPNIRKMRFTLQEDQLIAHYYKIHGANWKLIVKYLPGRTESMIRNRFYSTIKKKRQNLLSNESNQIRSALMDKMDECMEESQSNDNCNEDTEDPEYISESQQTQNYGQSKDKIMDLMNSENIQQDNYFNDFRIDYTTPVSNMDPMNLNKQLLNIGIREGENGKKAGGNTMPKNLQIETDPFMSGIMNQSPNRYNVEFEGLSPVINAALPVNMPWDDHDIYGGRFDCDDRFSFLNHKVDDVENDIANLRAFMDENCNSLIDFNQEAIDNRKLTPEAGSLCSREDIMLREAPQVEKKLEYETTIVQKANPPVERTIIKNPNISQLVDQIKSIEMLFDLTRKEISKLQDEFGGR